MWRGDWKRGVESVALDVGDDGTRENEGRRCKRTGRHTEITVFRIPVYERQQPTSPVRDSRATALSSLLRKKLGRGGV